MTDHDDAAKRLARRIEEQCLAVHVAINPERMRRIAAIIRAELAADQPADAGDVSEAAQACMRECIPSLLNLAARVIPGNVARNFIESAIIRCLAARDASVREKVEQNRKLIHSLRTTVEPSAILPATYEQRSYRSGYNRAIDDVLAALELKR